MIFICALFLLPGGGTPSKLSTTLVLWVRCAHRVTLSYLARMCVRTTPYSIIVFPSHCARAVAVLRARWCALAMVVALHVRVCASDACHVRDRWLGLATAVDHVVRIATLSLWRYQYVTHVPYEYVKRRA